MGLWWWQPTEAAALLQPPPQIGTVGTVTAFGGASAPSGWVLCDGTSYDTTTYSDLFDVIGYAFGGSGANFNVPDLRQRFPFGKATSGTGATFAGTGGAIDHTHTGPSHTHPVTQPDEHTAHNVTQPASHGTLTHANAALAAHSAMSHDSSITNHSISAEAGAHGTHAADTTHTHDAHGNTANTNNTGAIQGYSAPASHSANATHTHDAHSAHSGSTIDAHAITQADHSGDTHSVTAQADDHTSVTHSGSTVTGAHTHSGAATTAGGTGATGTANPPFQAMPYIIRSAA